MEDAQKTIEKEAETNLYKNKVHWTLTHSYFFYFFMFLIGFFFELIFPLKIFKDSIAIHFGAILILAGTVLIFWAQKTSRNLKKDEVTFLKGPYKITRSPTHWGLFLLMLGFSFIANALFVIISTLISFIVAKFIFLKKEELILENKYGELYKEYKKSVKF
ncbi:MAG TPA: methyltransferase [Candidatus Paceibacterota bacterium]|nr:methyltransferase [Candidatus Paceibacterota bacterium]HPT17989.1 methyltransferase [Candidatus Paceibacterota bacterium]